MITRYRGAVIETNLMPRGKLLVPPPGKVLITRDEAEDVYGSIIIPDAARQAPISGTIAAVGSDVEFWEPNDQVVFGQYAGAKVRWEGFEYDIMVAKDIHVKLMETN